MRCMSVSLSWVRLYREEGRSAVGDVGEAGFFSGSVVLVMECWNTLGDSNSEDSSPWTAGPAFTWQRDINHNGHVSILPPKKTSNLTMLSKVHLLEWVWPESTPLYSVKEKERSYAKTRYTSKLYFKWNIFSLFSINACQNEYFNYFSQVFTPNNTWQMDYQWKLAFVLVWLHLHS